MATINIIPPLYGGITVTDESESHYTVVYTATSAESFFNGFKVYCHACGRYVFQGASAGQSATINFTALQSDGHPGPFDISANEHEVEFLVETFSNDESMGTTTPVEKIMGANVGATVSYTISASARRGYRFIKWVEAVGGQEYTSASVNISTTIQSASDNYRSYTAFFGPQPYRYALAPQFRVSEDPVTGRSPDGLRHDSRNIEDVELRERLYYHGTLRDGGGSVVYQGTSPFAYIHGMPYRYVLGQQITVSLEITDQALWSLLGLRLAGWRISDRGSGDTVVDDDGSHSVSFTADHVPDHTGTDQYTVYAIICTSDFHKLEFTCEPATAAELYLLTSTYGGRRGVGPQVLMVKYGEVTKLNVMSLQGRYAASGFVHGWSAQLPDASGAAGSLVTKAHTMPDEDARIVVYICTHLLVCTDDGAHLECKPPELLCDCSVPPGTTVYD